MALDNVRIAEILNDLEDYETEWDEWETKFIRDIQQRMEEDEDDFKLIGKQEPKLLEIYDKYCKEPSV